METVDNAIARVTADAAYDTVACYEAAGMRDAPGVVPPSKTASGSRRRPRSRARDRTITDVRTLGRRVWKQEAGYPLQARVEHACFRDQSMIGDRLRARSRGGQVAESVGAGHVLQPDARTRSAGVVQYWSVTCLWVGIVDGQFRVMHQRRVAGRRQSRVRTETGSDSRDWIQDQHFDSTESHPVQYRRMLLAQVGANRQLTPVDRWQVLRDALTPLFFDT